MRNKIIIFILALIPLTFFSCSKNADGGKEPVVFRIGNGGEPASLDPSLIQGTVENRIYQALFEGLVSYDPETVRAVPGVAESWTVSEDNTVYTFKLRESAWSDGTPITAQTFIDSWKRTLDPNTGSPYAWFPGMFLKGAADITNGTEGAELGVKAIDDYTLEVTLVGPLPYALDAFAHYSFGIVPLHAVKEHGDTWTQLENIVTNGPFTLKEWVPQDKLIVQKNPNYWDADAVQVDEVVYIPVEDNNTGYNMFLNGELDWMTEVANDRIKEAMLRDDVVISPALIQYYYVLNHEVEPLNDVRVRKALSMAIDRDSLVERVTKAGEIASAAMVPEMSGYPALKGNTLNIKEAQRLLSEAGYPNGEGFPTFSLLYNTSDQHKAVAEFIQAQWETNLGINISLENQEWKTYLSNKTNKNYEIARAGWAGDYQDPNSFLDMFVTGADMNDMQYASKEYDTFISKAARMKAGEERFKVLQEAETLLVEKDQALIPLYTYVKPNMVDMNKWGGWYPNVLDLHPVRRVYKK